MSLINDALKRTKQAQEQQTPSLSRGAPLHIAAPPPRSSGLWALAVAALALAAVIAGVAVWYALQHRGAPAPLQAKVEPTPPPVAIERPVLPVIPAKIETPPPAPVAPPKKEIPPPAPVVVQQPASPVEPPAKVEFPALRLQGVLYSPTRPAAIINGRTLSIGDKISGVTVVRITSDKAFVSLNGVTNVLQLP